MNPQIHAVITTARDMAADQLRQLGESVAAQLGAHTRAAMADLQRDWGYAPAGIRGKR